MKILNFLNNRNYRVPVIFFIVILLIGSIKFFILKTGYTFPVFSFLETTYFGAIEISTNWVLALTKTDVAINPDHQIIFHETSEYVKANQPILRDWTDFLLFKKWSVFILFFVWVFSSSIKSRFLYTLFFCLGHFISVVSGLLLLTVVGPVVVSPGSLSQLRPNIFGVLIMLTLFVVWFKNNYTTFVSTLGKLRINIRLSNKTIKEIIAVVYLYSILRYFVVPYFNFYFYINFLLTATNSLVSLFNYHGKIDGPYLVGEGGTLFMAKWCLGFVTMFIFSSMIFLTGKDAKSIIYFTLTGIILLHIANIIRLATLFIIVQNISDPEKIDNHHFVYNLIVYVFVFMMWVVWFEKYSQRLRAKNQD